MIMPANSLANNGASIPFRVVIDFMEGTKRKADAVAFARGFIEHHFDSPADSWYYVQPYPGGYAFEVHEGGLGKAFLPNIIETLEVNPTAVLSVPMARRNLQVKKSLNGTYTAILLPEGLSTDEDHAVEAVSSRSMLRVTTTGLGIFTFGGIIFSAGFLAFFSALLMVFLDPAGIFFGGSRGTELQQLPILQWKSLSSASNDQSYVRNLSFSNGKWGNEASSMKPASRLMPRTLHQKPLRRLARRDQHNRRLRIPLPQHLMPFPPGNSKQQRPAWSLKFRLRLQIQECSFLFPKLPDFSPPLFSL